MVTDLPSSVSHAQGPGSEPPAFSWALDSRAAVAAGALVPWVPGQAALGTLRCPHSTW